MQRQERQGADRFRAPDRGRPQPGTEFKQKRVGPREYFGEVRSELKKVQWPGRREVVNSSVVVLIAVVFMTALIFAFDYGSSKFVLSLFG